MTLSYDYDETSETWPFFALTILLTILVPLTLSQLYDLLFNRNGKNRHDRRHAKGAVDEQLGDQIMGELSDKYTDESIKRFRKKYDKAGVNGSGSGFFSRLFSKKNLFILIGWVVVAWLVQRIMTNDAIGESAKNVFDPYELLGISSSATERQIKSAYRKLSLKFHPDKLPKDLTAEERKRMEESYVQISKAYEALTDPVTRENFLKYGHPDGPQSTSHGIALPSFLVDATASPILVASYVLSFVLLLPYLVSQWWNRTKSHTKKNIHVNTASYFVDRLVNYKPSEIVTVNLIIHWISHAEEFKKFYPNLTPETFEKLLQDHIHGRDSGDLNTVKYRIVAKCHTLLYGLLDIACGFRNTDIAIATLDTFKCIVQGIPMTSYSPILQLPNVDKEHFDMNSVEEIHTLGKLFTYSDDKIGKILGIKDPEKLKETLTVASNIPELSLLRADFVVPGEEFVSPHSTPHISIKVLIRSPKQRRIPVSQFPPESLREPQDFEDLRDPYRIMMQQPLLPYSFAPRFPTERRNAYCALVIAQKDNKILQTPVTINRLSLRNLTNDFDKRLVKRIDADSESFDIDEWEVGFINLPLGQPAPAQPGQLFMRVVIKSTDYFGSDLDVNMMMDIKEIPKTKSKSGDIDAQLYGGSDDDDGDNDARMGARGGQGESEDENEDEDELDLELEDDIYSDSSYTDIDTDTEVEEEEEEEEQEQEKQETTA